MLKQLKQRELRVEVWNVAKDGILKTLEILRTLKTLMIVEILRTLKILKAQSDKNLKLCIER